MIGLLKLKWSNHMRTLLTVISLCITTAIYCSEQSVIFSPAFKQKIAQLKLNKHPRKPALLVPFKKAHLFSAANNQHDDEETHPLFFIINAATTCYIISGLYLAYQEAYVSPVVSESLFTQILPLLKSITSLSRHFVFLQAVLITLTKAIVAKTLARWIVIACTHDAIDIVKMSSKKISRSSEK